ncbi:glutamine synthetase family protein [Gulosibacter sp. ACHW.36C]|uniref:Glutamine synthetase family protein n=1 Tax=Gulosibacter sediminis TaxID=1729695 RepID=A0ABY4MV71_9MICO|nr:glutamine synthetase family protein [Gulosibacter sediminis]UQN14330.1 glutamine synthetase family protein [Gulosibacter sediminis]
MTNHSTTTVEPHVEKLQTAAVELGRNLGDFYRESVEAALNDNGAFGYHQEQNLEDDTVAEIVEKIERSGVKYLYYMLPTLGARTVAKMVPAKHIVRNLEKGIAFHRTALSDLQSDIFGNLIGGGIEAKEFVGLPEPESFQQLPWDGEVGRIFCAAYEPEHLPGVGGRPLAIDSRANMQRTHQLLKDVFSLTMKSGTEPEMTWTGDSIEPTLIPGHSPAYQVENLEVMRPIYKRLEEYATALDFDMIEGDYEDKGQIELNWMFDDIERTADRLVTYRQICSQVAREFGVKASFMPKPYLGSMGNGCHHNLSLWGDEGTNTFITPGVTELHMSQLGRWAIGGVLKHAPAMMLVMASTVNSYKRFWDPGQFAPASADWGLDDRASMVRISANGRAEVRVPDASVNPYLSHSLLVSAMADGIGNEIEPPAAGSGGVDLPMTLGEAIEAFKSSDWIQANLPEDLRRIYLEMKSDEWARYCGAVTEWEFNQYWQAIP